MGSSVGRPPVQVRGRQPHQERLDAAVLLRVDERVRVLLGHDLGLVEEAPQSLEQHRRGRTDHHPPREEHGDHKKSNK